jgi:RNA polymerase sigma-70 factor (ECF subfamily)
MMSENTQVLLAEAKQGNRQSLGQLLQLLRPYVRVLARAAHGGRLDGRADDSDLIQEAHFEVVRSFDRFEGIVVPEFLAWLRQVVANTVHKSIRASIGTKKRNPGILVTVQDEDAEASSRDQPERRAEVREESARVALAMERLPDDMRQVLVMRLVDGRSHAEVAGELGRTDAAVRMLFVRAVRRLQEILAG